MTKKELLIWINREIERSERERKKANTEWQEGNDYGWITAFKKIKDSYYSNKSPKGLEIKAKELQ